MAYYTSLERVPFVASGSADEVRRPDESTWFNKLVVVCPNLKLA